MANGDWRPASLGVGVTYISGLHDLLQGSPEVVDVVEVEPQTLWLAETRGSDRYVVDQVALDNVRRLPQPKLVHGIGFPVGGTISPDPRHIPELRRTIDLLSPAWISEHLSFNRFRTEDDRGDRNVGFLLPPRQTDAGVAAAVRSIHDYARATGQPLAVETGVNYLRPRDDELRDGEFVAEVVRRAECGILLDLHNLYTNERNGRQSIEAFLADIPLDRVWEIHMAGGNERQGFWLDSHAGSAPDSLIDLATDVVQMLPNLGAVIFELFPAYLPAVGVARIAEELQRLRGIWDARSRGAAGRTTAQAVERTAREASGGPTPDEWERALGGLIIDVPVRGSLAKDLRADPGIEVTRGLLGDFRGSMIATTLRLTTRLLLLTMGEPRFRKLLEAFWSAEPPRMFASSEAEAFAEFLSGRNLEIPLLPDVLAYERATVDVLIAGQARTVMFTHEPMTVLRPLAEGRLPDAPTVGSYELMLVPDEHEGETEEVLLAQPVSH